MDGTALKSLDVLFALIFAPAVPLMAGAIGYAAWRGKLRRFTRDTFSTIFWLGTITLLVVGNYVSGLQADVRTWLFAWQATVYCFLMVLCGVTFGCGLAFLTYREVPQSKVD